MPTRTIYLVRHGQQAEPHSYAGLGNHLSEVGRKQAEYTADYLANISIDTIYHSTMLRAAETAAAIAKRHARVPVHPSRLLWEGVPYLPATVAQYFSDVTDEIIQRDRARFDRAFDRFFHPTRKPTTDVLVCHGGISRYLICRALHIPLDMWANLEFNNCGVTRVIIEPEFAPERDAVLYNLNLIDHIPEEFRTFI
ncbi:MAG: histidine phosphatase family protein [Anaerolineae bacterium]